MNDKATSKLRGKIQTLIRNIVLDNGEVNGWELIPNLRNLADFAGSVQSQFATPNHFFSYFYFQVTRFIESNEFQNHIGSVLNGKLADIADRELLEHYEKHLLSEVLEMPHNYRIRLLLQEKTEGPQVCVRLSDEAHLEVSPVLIIDSGEKEMGIYLVIDTTGFCGFSASSISITRCITILKVFLFIVWQDYKTYNLEYRSGLSELSTFDSHVTPKRKFFVTPKRNEHPYPISLPFDLNSLIVNFGFRCPIEEIDTSRINKLLNYESRGVERIRAAIEWYIDSVVTKADTVKFIQICIGLESLLGDESSDSPLTSTLADRCAYLVASTIDDRGYLRDKFKAMYRVRSKIIHGAARSLSEDESKHFDFARDMLREAILKEISHLKN